MAEGNLIYIRLSLSACFLSLIGCELFLMDYLRSMIPNARIANITIQRQSANIVTECNLKCLTKQDCKSTIYAGTSRKCVLLRSIPGNLHSSNLTNGTGSATSDVVLSYLMEEKLAISNASMSLSQNNTTVNQPNATAMCYNCSCQHQYSNRGQLCETNVHGFSCQDIKSNECSGDCLSGFYKIWLNSSKTDTITVYCDMKGIEDGWTEITYLKSNTSVMAEFKKVPFKIWHSLIGFDAVGNYHIQASALRALRESANFNQIRFKCQLPKLNKYLDLATLKNASGKAAFHWLIDESRGNVGPPSCGSLKRLSDDDSLLATRCADWSDGRWPKSAFTNGYHLLDHAMYITAAEHWNILGFISDHNRFECDNFREQERSIEVGDTWQIFVK